jgi:hypothetical protein
MRFARTALLLAALALAAPPAGALYRAKSVSGNLDPDPAPETVHTVKVPDPSDPANDALAQTQVNVSDSCMSGPIEVAIAGGQDTLSALRLLDADTHTGKDIFLDLRSGAAGRAGAAKVVSWRPSPGPACQAPKTLFHYVSTHPTHRPRGTVALTDFEVAVKDLERRFRGMEVRLMEGFARPREPLCCPAFRKTTFFRYDRGRDRYVRYRSSVRRVAR